MGEKNLFSNFINTWDKLGYDGYNENIVIEIIISLIIAK